MEITDWPNGKVDETRRKFSDEILVKEIRLLRRKVLPSTGFRASCGSTIDAAGVALAESTRNFAARDVFKFGDNYFKLFPICQRD